MKTFQRFAWVVLGYNVLVILWGAYVRATGSGAGCGSHWPLCNGEVLPRAPQIETLIEFTHRVTSGLALLLVLGLVALAIKTYSRSHPVRWMSYAVLFFTLTEALIGAGLVLFELVAQNTSLERAWAMSLHLLNTLLLLAALTLTAWFSRWLEGQGWDWNPSHLGLFLGAWLGMGLLGVSGAITALGDTLFPVSSLREGLAQDVSPVAHVFVRLRVFHPFIAVVVGLYIIGVVLRVKGKEKRSGLGGTTLIALILLQWAIGVINVVLLAPVAIQLLHLLITDLIWIALVLTSVQVLVRPRLLEGVSYHSVQNGVNPRPQQS
ncbi:COX15/CtaA family protein [Thermanaerothrix sp.]|uniref:COX15/CtaA family protein n=1 Tax=Thermanaerothrix sp. TaxID=2972675 RepID=UPI003C7D7078